MAISFVDASAMTYAATSPLVANLPTGYAEDDGLYVFYSAMGTTATRTITVDADYTEIGHNEPTTHQLLVARRIAGGSESAPSSTLGSPSSGWTSVMFALRGIDTDTPEDATAIDSDFAAATEATPTGITTNTDGAWVVSIVFNWDLAALGLKSGSEQGFTLQAGGADYDTTQGSGSHAVGVATKNIASAGAVTCPTWEQNGGSAAVWRCVTIAVKPDAAIPPQAGLTIDFSTDTITYIGGTGGGV